MDIVERLRIQEETGFVYLPSDWVFVGYGEAADEIERLREALKTIARFSEDWGAFAEAALQQKDSE